MYSGEPPKRQTSIHKLLFLMKSTEKKKEVKNKMAKKQKLDANGFRKFGLRDKLAYAAGDAACGARLGVPARADVVHGNDVGVAFGEDGAAHDPHSRRLGGVAATDAGRIASTGGGDFGVADVDLHARGRFRGGADARAADAARSRNGRTLIYGYRATALGPPGHADPRARKKKLS